MYDSRPETYKHIQDVAKILIVCSSELLRRASCHDQSKLESPEVEYFDKFTPMLSGVEYNSDEYKRLLEELKPALEHHYAKNSHHPEHFNNGVKGMTLFDILEMIADWLASSQRNKNGNIRKSIDCNQKRFNYSDELKEIFDNTVPIIEQLLKN